jgi:hypothetical protein
MSIDITRLSENELLPALGNADWIISLPTGYANLLISSAWREEIVAWAGTRFVRWVLSGVRPEITHDYDPPWDHSGQVRKRRADPLTLRILYSTLAEWLEEECTGQSRATYDSGYGLYWLTYGDELEEHIRERLTELILSQYRPSSLECEDDFQDVLWDDLGSVTISLEAALSLYVGQMSTAEIWKRFETLTYAQIEEEQRLSAERAAHYKRMHQLARQFWITHFADLQGTRIEQPEFKALHLEEHLRELFADADPDVVEAIAEVGLPGIFSNSVVEAIKRLAQNALSD